MKTQTKNPEPEKSTAREIDDKILELVDRGAIVYTSHSGGKDSQAMLIKLRDLGVPDEQIVIIHADLEGIEWKDTKKQIRDTIGNLPLHIVKNAKTFWDKVDHRGAFPSSGCRWCTSDLKRDPIHKLIRNDLKARGKSLAINAIGIRADESASRSKQEPVTFSKRQSKAGREIWDIFPIFYMTTEEVFENIRAAGEKVHWAYDAGMDRLSCCFCIMATDRDLTIAAEHNPELYVQYVEKERELGFTLKNGKTLEEITGIEIPTRKAA